MPYALRLIFLSRNPLMLTRLALLAALILSGACNAAFAQSDTAAYPSHVVKIVHQYTAGGGNDYLARIAANGLAERWGQMAGSVPGRDEPMRRYRPKLKYRAARSGSCAFLSNALTRLSVGSSAF